MHAQVGHAAGTGAHDEPIAPVHVGHVLHVPAAGLFLLFEDVSQNSLALHSDAVQLRLPQLSTPAQLHVVGVHFLPSTNEIKIEIMPRKIIFCVRLFDFDFRAIKLLWS